MVPVKFEPVTFLHLILHGKSSDMKYSLIKMFRTSMIAFAIITSLSFLPCLSAAQHVPDTSKKVNMISQKKFKRQMKNDEVVILDVRTPEEFNAGNIPGSILINYKDSSFSQQVNSLDKNKHYLVYCKAGNRSNKAVQYMLSNGFTKVHQLEDGFSKWKEPAKRSSN